MHLCSEWVRLHVIAVRPDACSMMYVSPQQHLPDIRTTNDPTHHIYKSVNFA